MHARTHRHTHAPPPNAHLAVRRQDVHSLHGGFEVDAAVVHGVVGLCGRRGHCAGGAARGLQESSGRVKHERANNTKLLVYAHNACVDGCMHTVGVQTRGTEYSRMGP